MAGCNYHISLTEVYESEKKLRIQKVFRHSPDHFKELTKTASDNDENILLQQLQEDIYLDDFIDVFHTEYLSDFEKERDDSSFEYVSGYGAHAVSKKIHCMACKSTLVVEKGEIVGDCYFDYLQRGGLSVSTPELKFLLFHMNAILNVILKTSSLKMKFLVATNQKLLLCKLSILSLSQEGFAIDFESTCVCGRTTQKLYNLVRARFANILLNNYSKAVNNNRDEIKQEAVNRANLRKIQNFQKSKVPKSI
jgi:hypothetical protein